LLMLARWRHDHGRLSAWLASIYFTCLLAFRVRATPLANRSLIRNLICATPVCLVWSQRGVIHVVAGRAIDRVQPPRTVCGCGRYFVDHRPSPPYPLRCQYASPPLLPIHS
jgi:hypothetical protein